jgi:elongation factor P hydroxylase
MHDYHDLITIFNHCFAESHNTRLLKGDNEPIYLPADKTCPYHAIFFAHGFYSSALHECAHWLLAGEDRRKQVDFGYWYEPDGRNAQQQALFLQVEVKPQALEWILSQAATYRFRISLDNLSGEATCAGMFKEAVYQQVLWYCVNGLPARARRFRAAICDFYQQKLKLDSTDFMLEGL